MKHHLLDRLGLTRRSAVAGVHLSGGTVTMAIVRPNPLRLTAIAHRSTPNDGPDGLADALTSLARAVRLPRRAPIVVTIEPSGPLFTAFDDQRQSIVVDPGHVDRVRAAMRRADLDLDGLDVVPAALARVARLASPEIAVVRGAYHWRITTGLGYTEATRAVDDGPRLRIDTDPVSALPIAGLPLAAVKAIRAKVDPDRDALAVGAALAALDHPPLVVTTRDRDRPLPCPEPPPVPTGDQTEERPQPDPIEPPVVAAVGGASSTHTPPTVQRCARRLGGHPPDPGPSGWGEPRPPEPPLR